MYSVDRTRREKSLTQWAHWKTSRRIQQSNRLTSCNTNTHAIIQKRPPTVLINNLNLGTQLQSVAVKRSAQVQYNYNTTTRMLECFLVLQLYCTCGDPCNTTLQYKFSTTCRKLVGYSSCKKTCIACSCIALVWTAAIQQNFALCHCSCIVLHLCEPLNI